MAMDSFGCLDHGSKGGGNGGIVEFARFREQDATVQALEQRERKKPLEDLDLLTDRRGGYVQLGGSRLEAEIPCCRLECGKGPQWRHSRDHPFGQEVSPLPTSSASQRR